MSVCLHESTVTLDKWCSSTWLKLKRITEMASLIDSEAVFSARLRASDLGGLEPVFAARGWTTMSTFAFASSWVPGVGDDTAFQNAVLNPLLGRADHARAPKVRKLYFECYTMVAADIKSKIDAGPEDSSKVRKLAAAERKSRWETMKANYPHMNFKSDAMEPAHAVIDKCHTMRVDGDVKYIPPHEVPTRDQEMQSVKTEELIKRDASGHLKAQEESKVPEADTKTDLRMRQAGGSHWRWQMSWPSPFMRSWWRSSSRSIKENPHQATEVWR